MQLAMERCAGSHPKGEHNTAVTFVRSCAIAPISHCVSQSGVEHSGEADLLRGEVEMARLGRIGVLTLLCCSLPFTADRASAGSFEITNFTSSYVYMPLPGTLGESVTFDWAITASDNGLSGLSGVADRTPVTMSGTANLGPLLSLDAEWDADGSIGIAEYLFGEGTFALELSFDLLNGTPHTMDIRGALGPTSVYADDSGSSPIILNLLHAKVDPKSAALFGMKRQISGSTYYYTDLYDMGSPDRELALFGFVYFDYTPVKHQKSADLTAVPEPGAPSLLGLGVAAAILRRSALRRFVSGS